MSPFVLHAAPLKKKSPAWGLGRAASSQLLACMHRACIQLHTHERACTSLALWLFCGAERVEALWAAEEGVQVSGARAGRAGRAGMPACHNMRHMVARSGTWLKQHTW